jgi:hypothetical protein
VDAVPPPLLLQKALRAITERLATDLANPCETAPDWSDVEWKIARAVAAMHGISALLSRSLRWRGPDSWHEFLDSQRIHTANRHLRMAGVLSQIDQRARQQGIAALALKGAALHSLGVYNVGDRPMADIDLLVRVADVQRTSRLIESLKFHESDPSWNAREFVANDHRAPAALGEHSENALKIELHAAIGARLPVRITDITDAIFPTQARAGLNGYPSTASLMLHLVLHAADSMPFRGLRLMHVHDLAQMSAQMSTADWDEFLAYGSRAQPLWWAFPPLQLASRYYAGIPQTVLRKLAQVCPFVLRRIAVRNCMYDVSYSYPWVNAFPGIAWTQSPREAASYVASRLRPSSTHLAMRAVVANQAWAQQERWARQSQGRRILRWVSSRQTRQPTMYLVHAAFAQRQ